MKEYEVRFDITYTKSFYVTASSEENARTFANDEAWSNHHGGVITKVDIIDIGEKV